MARRRMDELALAGQRVTGRSVGGLETWIHLPELKLCFDIGRAEEASLACPTVLFTHGHVDHLGGLASHAATRTLRGMAPPTYVVPRDLAPAVEDLLDCWKRLDGARMACEVVPLGPGERLELGRDLVARPFAADHFGPAQGYVLARRKKRLRQDLAGLDGAAIRARAAAGEPVNEVLEQPLLAFSGDTRADVLDRCPELFEVPLLVLEATFLDDRVSVESAREKGHVHLDELLERADLFRNEAILLTHFSARYNGREVREILARRLPASLRERVTPLLAGFR